MRTTPRIRTNLTGLRRQPFSVKDDALCFLETERNGHLLQIGVAKRGIRGEFRAAHANSPVFGRATHEMGCAALPPIRLGINALK